MHAAPANTVMTLAEYMEDRRKVIDRYVEGEHRWYGDLSTAMPAVSMHEHQVPWYLQQQPGGGDAQPVAS